MRKYIDQHPLKDLLSEQRWNNVPLCIYEMIDLSLQTIIAQDIHTWERKYITNQRFQRLQTLIHKLSSRHRTFKASIHKKLQTQATEIEEDKIKLTHQMNTRMEKLESSQDQIYQELTEEIKKL